MGDKNSEEKNIIMKKIVCFHLYNDFSGSPKVLKVVLEGLLRKGCMVDLVTSRGGVLDILQITDYRLQPMVDRQRSTVNGQRSTVNSY